MKAVFLLVLGFPMVPAAFSAVEQPAGPAVNVYIQNSVIVPMSVLKQAQLTARRIFDEAGIRLQFVSHGPHRKEKCAYPTIEVRLDAHAPTDRSPWVLGYASLHDRAGARVHLFYNRIRAVQAGALAPPLLGHVMAHEIAHVLQGVDRHSATGLLKARWGEADYALMAVGRLRMTAEDAQLIRESLENTAN